jgi:transaldolase
MAAQRYFRENSIPTKVKACANYNIDEIMNLAGIGAFTLTPSDLQKLAGTPLPQDFKQNPGLLKGAVMNGESSVRSSTYVQDEGRYRIDFAARDGGGAQYRLLQVSVSNLCQPTLKLITTLGFGHLL